MTIADISMQEIAGNIEEPTHKSRDNARAKLPPRRRLGRVISVSDTQLLILIEAPETGFEAGFRPRVGLHVCIEGDDADVVATISALSAPNMGNADDWTEVMIAEVELVGEIVLSQRHSDSGIRRVFRRGIEKYPALGQISSFISDDDLECMYGIDQSNEINVGRISHETDLPVTFNWNKLCTGNIGIFGAASVGKSCALVKIIRALVMSRHPASIVILDVNNEYSRSFGRAAENVAIGPGALPYWLLNRDELISILECGGHRVSQDEYNLLDDAVSTTRRNFRYRGVGAPGIKARIKSNNNLDTPYPYALEQLISYLDKISASQKHGAYAAKLLSTRLGLAIDNREFECFFGRNETPVQLSQLISQLFRLPKNNKPISIIKLAHLSGTALDVAVSMIARLGLAVGKWGQGRAPIVLCLDEAHRFMAAPSSHQGVAVKTISQCLEMGKKYGIGMGLVSSRPRAIDKSCLDQLNTLIAMRHSTQADQILLNEIAPEIAHGMLSSIGTLNAAEAIVLGSGVSLPMRLKFETLSKEALPGVEQRQTGARAEGDRREAVQAAAMNDHFVNEIIEKWRGT